MQYRSLSAIVKYRGLLLTDEAGLGAMGGGTAGKVRAVRRRGEAPEHFQLPDGRPVYNVVAGLRWIANGAAVPLNRCPGFAQRAVEAKERLAELGYPLQDDDDGAPATAMSPAIARDDADAEDVRAAA